ncbi:MULTISPECIES: MucR family transcriptional regulator [Bosea]|jgi:predicted transcriptional regulator|uniref:MucR family transcriptional regulator n=1 Tax=Bosea vaviloviae TaxID=1526658 RepID=A0A1D7TX53_9HYPH|nr:MULTISPECIES: MucR family transcriptional regulator [Bosea]AOO79700.1 MucR family transcriptional regulator [Bosea vaviloviae]MDR6873589.1 putative transcriptional regulator [Bosea sp. BE125]
MSDDSEALIGLSAMVVAAYVAHNNVPRADLPGLIASTHAALAGLGEEPAAAPAGPLVPAVPIKKSVTPDAIICLEDGKAFKSMKRHLGVSYGMTPAEYRTKWGLPADYPMVAPNYAEARSALAKTMGLGRKAAAARSTQPARRSKKVPA